MEVSINERINSNLYSDVINSYVDINAVTSQRNIVPGSYKETVVQCTDQTLATLNSAGGQTLFTRFKLTPQVRNATLAQLAQIYFQYVIPANELAIVKTEFAANSTAENFDAAAAPNYFTNGTYTEKLRFKLFYDSGFSIASMVQLCLTADAKVSTENFNYQQSLLTLNSLPDYVTEHSNCESTLKALVEDPTYRGVGSGIVEVDLSTGAYSTSIPKDISIEGCIDLNRGNPLFHNFPIITRNMQEFYIRLYMENFLRELKIVYLNKTRTNLNGMTITSNGITGSFPTADGTLKLKNSTTSPVDRLPYVRLPVDKPDFVYLDGKLVKVRLVATSGNTMPTGATTKWNTIANPIYASVTNVSWKRFEIRKVEFDIEDYEDIKASQAKAATYKFPVHLFRSKNFDQTNAASSSSNALQTTLNAPNIDRIFITQPWSRDYYTFLPTPAVTDINPQLHNNPILPRTEDDLNARTVERICSVFVDTDKYSPPRDLYASIDIPTINKQLWLKGPNTYGGDGAFEKIQRGIDLGYSDTHIILPNKFAYAIELNEGGCFRRGFNSVIDGKYSPTVPINLQQSTQTSANIYCSTTYDTTDKSDKILENNMNFNSQVSFGDLRASGAVASVHCLCDYIFWFSFDPYGNMVDFGVSPYNDRQ